VLRVPPWIVIAERRDGTRLFTRRKCNDRPAQLNYRRSTLPLLFCSSSPATNPLGFNRHSPRLFPIYLLIHGGYERMRFFLGVASCRASISTLFARAFRWRRFSNCSDLSPPHAPAINCEADARSTNRRPLEAAHFRPIWRRIAITVSSVGPREGRSNFGPPCKA
jgi:hypothetical protein